MPDPCKLQKNSQKYDDNPRNRTKGDCRLRSTPGKLQTKIRKWRKVEHLHFIQ